jgi:hypothetical protein
LKTSLHQLVMAGVALSQISPMMRYVQSRCRTC